MTSSHKQIYIEQIMKIHVNMLIKIFVTKGISSSLISSSLTGFTDLLGDESLLLGEESLLLGEESLLLGDESLLLGLGDRSCPGDLTGEVGSVLTFTFSPSSFDFSLCFCSDDELCLELLPSLCLELWLLEDELCLWLLDELCLLDPSL
jgi:hypothetical protein